MKKLLEMEKWLYFLSHWSLLLMNSHEQHELGGGSGVRFCHSRDTRKQHWNGVILYDLCKYEGIFWILPGSVSLRMHILSLVSLDKSFAPVLGELRRNTTQKSSSNFPFPLLLLLLSRRDELIQLFILEPNIKLHITKTIQGDFQYKFGSSTALYL